MLRCSDAHSQSDFRILHASGELWFLSWINLNFVLILLPFNITALVIETGQYRQVLHCGGPHMNCDKVEENTMLVEVESPHYFSGCLALAIVGIGEMKSLCPKL